MRSLVVRACCPSFVTTTHALTVGSVESGAHSFDALQSPSRHALVQTMQACTYDFRPLLCGRAVTAAPVSHALSCRERSVGMGGAAREYAVCAGAACRLGT